MKGRLIAGVIVGLFIVPAATFAAMGCSPGGTRRAVDAAAFDGALHDAGNGGPVGDYPPEDGEGGPDCGGPLTGDDAGTFSLAGHLLVARSTPALAPLPDGKILVAGGVIADEDLALTSAEVFDPSTGTSTMTGSMLTEHLWGGWGAPLPTLPDGQILVAGGVNEAGAIQAGAELYDPEAGTFRQTGPMVQAVVSMFPVVLADGSVLYVGGSDVSVASSPASCPGVFGCWSGIGVSGVQRYSPATGAFAATGPLAENRPWGCNVVLTNGNVLAIGGNSESGPPDQHVERYDPAVGVWQTVGAMPTPYCSLAFMLPNGAVLMVGTGASPDAQLLDPTTLAASPTYGYPPNWFGGYVQLANGDVLTVGKECSSEYAWRYSVPSNSWGRVAAPYLFTNGAAMVLLSNGDVALVGGTTDVLIFHP